MRMPSSSHTRKDIEQLVRSHLPQLSIYHRYQAITATHPFNNACTIVAPVKLITLVHIKQTHHSHNL